MAFGEIWWHTESLDPKELEDALNSLLIGGLTQENPGTGATNFIDDEGQQVEGEISWLLDHWLTGVAITLQFWVSRESDVLVTADRSSNTIRLDLDGLTFLEAKRTVFATVGAAGLNLKTRAVIVHGGLPDTGEDWLSYLKDDQRAAGEPPGRADVLMTRTAVAGRYAVSIDPASWLMVAR